MRAAIQYAVSNVVSAPRWSVWLPGWGVIAFAASYVVASATYSTASGSAYDHLSNYWCDLLARTSGTGEPNQARPFALLGTCLLPLSLVPLWYHLPVLFVPGSRWWLPARAGGIVAMLSATLVWTSLHDVILNLVAVFGFIALAGALLGIDARRHRAVFMAAWAAGALVLTNYVLWVTKTWTWAVPAVQKLAFLGLFVWVAVASSAIRRTLVVDR